MVAKSEYIVYIENLSSSTRSSDVKCVPNPPEAAEMSLRLRFQSLPSRSIEVMCDSCVGRSVCDMATSMRWKGTTLRNQRLWSSGGEHLHLSLECCMELHFHIQCGMNEPAAEFPAHGDIQAHWKTCVCLMNLQCVPPKHTAQALVTGLCQIQPRPDMNVMSRCMPLA